MWRIIRIRKRSEYLSVGSGSVKVGTRSIVVLGSRYGDGVSYVGFTAAKRIGCAVVRNRSRRRMKFLVEECSEKVGLSGLSFIFIATKGTARMKFCELKSDFLYALSRCGKMLKK